MAERRFGAPLAPLFLEVEEEVHLVVLGRAEDGGGDEDGGHVQGDSGRAHDQEHHQDREQRGDHGHEAGGAAAEDDQEGREDDPGREQEALHQRGHEVGGDLVAEEALAHDPQPAPGQQRLGGGSLRPEPADLGGELRCARPRARPREDGEPGVGERGHVHVRSQAALREQELLQLLPQAPHLGRILGQSVAEARCVAPQAQDRGQPVHRADLGLALERGREAVEG